MKYIVCLFILILPMVCLAQEVPQPPSRVKDSAFFRENKNRRLDSKEKKPEVSIEQYQIISFKRDTTYLDTTLSIQKEYRYNYLRKDNFELMPFANVGQPYNSLGHRVNRVQYYPRLGARARHFNYMEVEDIPYYNVPTPMTDLMFKTTFEQGQMLDAIITFNTSRRTNFSVAYKGFRSLGKYQFSQGESGNFRTSFNTSSLNGRYQLRAHTAHQDIEGEENGGLLNKEEQFESGNPDFDDRSRIDVNFSNANNKILGKRYYLDHAYILLRSKQDSTGSRKTSLALGHTFNYESKYYQFQQSAQNDFFGDVILSPIDDKATNKTMMNELSLSFANKTLGSLKGFAQYFDYDYFFNSLLTTPSGQIDNRLAGEELVLGGQYKKSIGPLSIEGTGMYTLTGELTDSFLDAEASYKIKEGWTARAGIHSSSRMPDYNFLLYQSEYLNYNWQNDGSFEKEQVNSLRAALTSDKWGEVEVQYSILDNYSYFASTATQAQIDEGQENAFIQPFQEGNSINYLKIKLKNDLSWGKWSLANTVMLQQVSQDSQVLNVPTLVTRNSLYFSSEVFDKALFLQTGVTFKYFTSYQMNAYNPLLSEFYVQQNEEIGGFPMLDLFINAKVKQTRIYLKAEHFNSSFSKNTFYAAPGYPYRDFVIRFGLVWNFFS
ncbi:MAG: putative porin [Flavobacteriaceae bacterium]|nr:putative porin [Flavobacteriaceae bacterium]